MKVTRVNHVGIAVSDYAEAHELLAGKLGFAKVRDIRLPNGNVGAFYRLGDFEVEIVQHGPAMRDIRLEGAKARIDHLALEVDDLGSAVGALAALGITGALNTSDTGKSLRSEKSTTAGFTIQFLEPPAR